MTSGLCCKAKLFNSSALQGPFTSPRLGCRLVRPQSVVQCPKVWHIESQSTTPLGTGRESRHAHAALFNPCCSACFFKRLYVVESGLVQTTFPLSVPFLVLLEECHGENSLRAQSYEARHPPAEYPKQTFLPTGISNHLQNG